jgi:hypothetical protein
VYKEVSATKFYPVKVTISFPLTVPNLGVIASSTGVLVDEYVTALFERVIGLSPFRESSIGHD